MHWVVSLPVVLKIRQRISTSRAHDPFFAHRVSQPLAPHGVTSCVLLNLANSTRTSRWPQGKRLCYL